MRQRFFATKLLLQRIAFLRVEGVRQSSLARTAQIPRTRFSEIVNARYAVKRDDPRVLALCAAVGITFDEAFAPLEQTPAP